MNDSTVCPNCGGPAWDNTPKVQSGWKGPLQKCQDQDGCGWAKWPKRPKKAKGGGGGRSSAPARPAWTWKKLAATYGTCVKIAVHRCANTPELRNTQPADLIASANALFDVVARDGVEADEPNGPS